MLFLKTFLGVLFISLLIGSVSLRGSATPPLPDNRSSSHLQTAVLAGGCFWGLQDVFEKLKGVHETTVGYSGGSADTAKYETVSTGTTGHAESLKIVFDPAVISYKKLLDVYFTVAHDPTTLNRQGNDVGSQYRSVIFVSSDSQRKTALSEIARLTSNKTFSRPIVTQVVPFNSFYVAESYHQHFADRNPYYPYILLTDTPKTKDLRSKFPQLLVN